MNRRVLLTGVCSTIVSAFVPPAVAKTDYWAVIARKRALRTQKLQNVQATVRDDYVLEQPPARKPSKRPKKQPSSAFPVKENFLDAGKKYFSFAPEMKSESEFRNAYIKAAIAAGLTLEQVVKIYAFEAGGNGQYDTQAGLEIPGRGHAISTAIGYNQILRATTVEYMASKGDNFLDAVRVRASTAAEDEREPLEEKIVAIKKMIAYCKHVMSTRADTSAPECNAIHSLIYDIDIGPLLQVETLLDGLTVARRHGVTRILSAAELEMMNLTGNYNGLDMILMNGALREIVPTANFFERRGYYLNAIARRNNTVALLLAATDEAMERAAQEQGAKEMSEAYKQALADTK